MRRPSRGAAGGETRRKAGKHWGRWDKRIVRVHALKFDESMDFFLLKFR